MSEDQVNISVVTSNVNNNDENNNNQNNYYSNNKSELDRRLKLKWFFLGFGWLTFCNFAMSLLLWALLCPLVCLPCYRQLLKVCRLSLFPFTLYSEHEGLNTQSTSVKCVRSTLFEREKTSMLIVFINLMWFLTFGWWIACIELCIFVILYLSFVGRGFARRHLALANVLAMPFGVFIKY
ncbi:hypothetical protein C9374_014357 [Naegleria lovaniensis]|uniref:Inner membrane component domain-containing protein n=1 Tax=Naegleria lovaniensis TaxID=51637 RepID=A0AA88GU67_NAELO|nr:uncharacterized protein C9374_014357 [Naegleria lovaniensis]KAG2388957.1 hypothetical protein C9374_014357 [Naegleria lovaniensis]